MTQDKGRKKIVIFVNGEVADVAWLRGYVPPNSPIICADGGVRHAQALGLKPHWIIGDLDSADPDLIQHMRRNGVEIIRYPTDKNQTDLALALRFAALKQPAEIILMGALGGRFDQMLGNIMLLTRPEYAEIRLTLVEAKQIATLLRDHDRLVLSGKVGDTLSLIPLSETVTGVTLEGVMWPLRGATLERGSTWTISNQFAAPSVTISIETGLLLAIHLVS